MGSSSCPDAARTLKDAERVRWSTCLKAFTAKNRQVAGNPATAAADRTVRRVGRHYGVRQGETGRSAPRCPA